MLITKNNLIVVGVGTTKPIMTGKVCASKGIIVTAGQNTTIKNLELYGATNNENFAGIRHDAAGFNLNLRNMYIHDNDNGLLSSSSGDNLIIINSQFERNGMNNPSGYGHNVYINHSALFVFRQSQSLRAKLGGHEIKTRALSTKISDSVIATLDGEDSRAIDIAEGGLVVIARNVFEKGPASQNNEFISYAPEGYHPEIENKFSMWRNQVIEDRGNGPVVLFYTRPSHIGIFSNVFVGPDAAANFGKNANNLYFPDRASAGYEPYPWLPAPFPPSDTAPPPEPPAEPSNPPTTWPLPKEFAALGVQKTIILFANYSDNAAKGDALPAADYSLVQSTLGSSRLEVGTR